MNLATTAIVPVVLILAIGALLRRRFIRDEVAWRGLEWTSYHVFLPALFVNSLAAADLGVVPFGALAISVALPLVAVSALVIVLRRPLRATGPQLTSVMQGAIRINTYIGLIFAAALNGALGVATFAVAAAIVVPLVNVICVSTLVVYGDKSASVRRVPLWRELLENPLILGCVIGLVINLSGIKLPKFAAATFSLLASPALVCGTLVAGAALEFAFQRRDLLHIGAATLLKLVVVPLAGAALALWLGITGAALVSVVLICAVPTATSANILASRMGGDTRLIASITGVETIIAMGTLPLVLGLLHHIAR